MHEVRCTYFISFSCYKSLLFRSGWYFYSCLPLLQFSSFELCLLRFSVFTPWTLLKTNRSQSYSSKTWYIPSSPQWKTRSTFLFLSTICLPLVVTHSNVGTGFRADHNNPTGPSPFSTVVTITVVVSHWHRVCGKTNGRYSTEGSKRIGTRKYRRLGI